MTSKKPYNWFTDAFKDQYPFNNPITLTTKNLSPTASYYITKKLDGERRLLILSQDGCYTLSTKMKKEPLKIKYKGENNIVLDAEFYKSKYYIFDCLYDNKDIRKYPFIKRKTIFNNIVRQLGVKSIVVKSFKLIKGSEMCSSIKNYTFSLGKLDGVILTPPGDYYSKVLKYKPPHMLSIDFKIRHTPSQEVALIVDKKEKETIFQLIKSTARLGKIKEGAIVEFRYDHAKNSWVFMRERPDKTKSNAWLTVSSNHKEIMNPSVVC
jgi:hypothetical protein